MLERHKAFLRFFPCRAKKFPAIRYTPRACPGPGWGKRPIPSYPCGAIYSSLRGEYPLRPTAYGAAASGGTAAAPPDWVPPAERPPAGAMRPFGPPRARRALLPRSGICRQRRLVPARRRGLLVGQPCAGSGDGMPTQAAPLPIPWHHKPRLLSDIPRLAIVDTAFSQVPAAPRQVLSGSLGSRASDRSLWPRPQKRPLVTFRRSRKVTPRRVGETMIKAFG